VGDRHSCRALVDLIQALGDEVSAEGWFAKAERDHLQAETPPWLARTRVDWAEQKLALGDLPRAEELARAALDAIGGLELTMTRERAARIVGYAGSSG